MAGKIVADQIEHSTAGSLSTEYVVEGSAKSWVNFTGVTTTASRDSFNTSSLTDAGTGQTNPISFTSNMNNANYSGSYFQNSSTGTAYSSFNNQHTGGFGSFATSSYGVYSYGSGDVDSALNYTIIVGDLA